MEAAATRDALLDAALTVFRDRGVAHTSLEEVAAAAGVTRGAVYWHFRDKADLFTALCERVQLPMEAMLALAGGARHDDPLGALRALAINGLTVAEGMASVAKRQHTTDSGCLANVERLLKQAVAMGQLPRDTDTRLAARCMNAYVVGVMREWVQQPDAYDLKRAAPRMIDMLIAGLREDPPRRAPAAGRAPATRRPRAHVAG